MTHSVVICAYTEERWDNVIAAVDSLNRQSAPPHEVILVIDYNSDLLERAEIQWPSLKVLANNRARGLSGARNTGVLSATGVVVSFLDDDAHADPRWAERLLACYEDYRVVGVGGWVVPAWRAARPAWFPEEFLWVVGCSYHGLPQNGQEIRNPIGACMSFRRDVFSRAGLFDESIGRLGKDAAGCEETELSIRVRQHFPAGRIVLAREAVVHHSVSAERTGRSYFRRRCLGEGKSKALVAGLAGQASALSTETEYVRRVLPRAFVRGWSTPAGRAQSVALLEGLALTTWGYVLRRCQGGAASRT